MGNRNINISVRKLPNGYALNIGKRRYMYFNAERLLGGIMLHLGCKELGYIDTEELDTILLAISTWDNSRDAFQAAADMMRYNKELCHKLRIEQATNAGWRKKYEALRIQNMNLKKQLKNIRL